MSHQLPLETIQYWREKRKKSIPDHPLENRERKISIEMIKICKLMWSSSIGEVCWFRNFDLWSEIFCCTNQRLSCYKTFRIGIPKRFIFKKNIIWQNILKKIKNYTTLLFHVKRNTLSWWAQWSMALLLKNKIIKNQKIPCSSRLWS